MNKTVKDSQEEIHSSSILPPTRALHKKYIEPILYLADRMSASDGKVVGREINIIDELASAANIKDFRHQAWYRDITQSKACEKLDVEVAKRGALIIMALVLKADIDRQETEHVYFSKVRALLGHDPVTVPTDIVAHKELALKFIKH